MTKSATKRAIRALPALRASIIWHKREVVRDLRARAACASSPKLRGYLHEKARKVSRTELADLRHSYEAARVNEIVRARRSELARVVPSIVWLTAEAHDRWVDSGRTPGDGQAIRVVTSRATVPVYFALTIRRHGVY